MINLAFVLLVTFPIWGFGLHMTCLFLYDVIKDEVDKKKHSYGMGEGI